MLTDTCGTIEEAADAKDPKAIIKAVTDESMELPNSMVSIQGSMALKLNGGGEVGEKERTKDNKELEEIWRK